VTHYVIGAEGCDDTTYALVGLTDEQAEGVRLCMAALNPRSSMSCQPVLYFENALTADNYKLRSATDYQEDDE
jgi:hypothetical protein